MTELTVYRSGHASHKTAMKWPRLVLSRENETNRTSASGTL
jgi:hypothetical protein